MIELLIMREKHSQATHFLFKQKAQKQAQTN